MLNEVRTGPAVAADGTIVPARAARMGSMCVTDAHSHFYETTFRGLAFSLTLTATTTGVAAGNLVGAAAAASTQFALLNPLNSARVAVLTKFATAFIGGTAPTTGGFHGVFLNQNSTVAAAGSIRNNLVGSAVGSALIPVASAAGTALTAGPAPVVLRALAMPSITVGVTNVELIDGDIVLPPGTGWVPLWGAAGTAALNSYSVSWEELPL